MVFAHQTIWQVCTRVCSPASRRLLFLVSGLAIIASLMNASRLSLEPAIRHDIVARSLPHLPERISYHMQPGQTYKESFINPTYRCNVEAGVRQSLPDELQTLMHYLTTISTDLKILVMGDSVGIQLSQGLEEATGASSDDRSVLRYSWARHEGIHVSAPVHGGGVVAGYRLLGMLRRIGEDKPLPNAPGGGWNRTDVDRLRAIEYQLLNGTNAQVGDFDALVFRIPLDWMGFDDLTNETLAETVELAHELFGVRTVIFITMPLSNNMLSTELEDELFAKNEMLRQFARNYHSSAGKSSTSVEHVQVLEFGRLFHSLLEWNARHLGYDTSLRNYTMNKLASPHNAERYVLSIPLVCASRVPHGAAECEKNSITNDGQHQCMGTIGGRFYAGLACVLGCIYNGGGVDHESTDGCARGCNDGFLNLDVVINDTALP
jgi:hypothetical protein